MGVRRLEAATYVRPTQISRLRHAAGPSHVWTAPGWQEESDTLHIGRVLPCVRPLYATPMAAGPNAIRWLRSHSLARALSTRDGTGFPKSQLNRFALHHIHSAKFLVPLSHTAGGAGCGARWVPPSLSKTQAMRAILLASATAATLVGFRAIRSRSHSTCVPRRLAYWMTVIAPPTRSHRK